MFKELHGRRRYCRTLFLLPGQSHNISIRRMRVYLQHLTHFSHTEGVTGTPCIFNCFKTIERTEPIPKFGCKKCQFHRRLRSTTLQSFNLQWLKNNLVPTEDLNWEPKDCKANPLMGLQLHDWNNHSIYRLILSSYFPLYINTVGQPTLLFGQPYIKVKGHPTDNRQVVS